MVSEKMELSLSDGKAYRISYNLDHLFPDRIDEDAWLIEFPGSKRIDNSTFWRVKERLNLPERVEFNALGFLLDVIDYLYTDVRWPIMSKKMISTLLSIGDFQHITYPVVMIDCEEVLDRKTGKRFQPRIENHNYVAVHVLEDLDVFDWENSIYEVYPEKPQVIKGIEKVVLKEPDKGFPPLFRVVPQLRTKLYVSAAAQAALAAAGIRGVDFHHVSDDRFVRELSLP